MPFHLTSLLFVGWSSLLLAFFASAGGATWVLAIVMAFFLLSWLNKYAFALLEHAADGLHDAPVATVEMLGPFGGLRPLVHVVLGGAVAIAWWRLGSALGPWLGALALLLFPASLVALATSQRLVDALSPAALWHVMRGLGWCYWLLSAAIIVIGALAWLTVDLPLSNFPRFVVLELLFLCYYTLVGSCIHWRRGALQFEARFSPERQAARAEQERLQQRQRMLDEVYVAMQARDYARVSAHVVQWLGHTDNTRLRGDCEAILTQAATWPEQRGVLTVARTLIAQLLRARQLSLALATLEAARRHLPDCTPETEANLLELARYAQFAGQRQLALTLIDNWQQAAPDATLSPAALQLRRELSG